MPARVAGDAGTELPAGPDADGDSRRSPGRPRNSATDAAILDATVDELIDRGFLALTIEGVAARAGVAKTTVYRRYPGRDELVVAALSELKGPLAVLPEGIGVRDGLVELVDWMRHSWMDSRHGTVMRRLAAEGDEHRDLYQHFRDRLIRPRQRLLLDLIRRGMREGIIRADVDPQHVLELLTAPTISAAMTHGRQRTRADAEFVVDTVLSGLRP